MTPNKEDYLKMIFEIGGDDALISNKQIVAGMHVSAASVSEMINKLVEQGLVAHTPYQGIQLTPTGRKAAALLVRNHRLWEVFLVKYLHYPIDGVHPEAEALEHAMTPEMAERLDAMLGEPKYCPHGGVIPDESGYYTPQSRTTLTQLTVGTRGAIERFIDQVALIDYIVALDLRLGDQFTVLKQTQDHVTLELVRTHAPLEVDAGYAGHIFVKAA